jgi:cytochrome P450
MIPSLPAQGTVNAAPGPRHPGPAVRRPDAAARLGEETWRFYPPFPAARRRAVAATTLGGQRLRAGTWVLGWLTAANRALDQFPDPNHYNIRRSPNRHLSFGRGRRSCLGAALARLEMTIALQVLLERLPRLRRDRTQPLRAPMESSTRYSGCPVALRPLGQRP